MSIKWSKRKVKALKASIRHWERLAGGKRREDEGIGPVHCALCRAYSTNGSCPIAEYTGVDGCGNTPYGEADETEEEFGLDSPEFLAAAAKELKFLRGLLPKDER